MLHVATLFFSALFSFKKWWFISAEMWADKQTGWKMLWICCPYKLDRGNLSCQITVVSRVFISTVNDRIHSSSLLINLQSTWLKNITWLFWSGLTKDTFVVVNSSRVLRLLAKFFEYINFANNRCANFMLKRPSCDSRYFFYRNCLSFSM